MKWRLRLAVGAACALAAIWTVAQEGVAAQWITIKTPDVPLLPNGKPIFPASG